MQNIDKFTVAFGSDFWYNVWDKTNLGIKELYMKKLLLIAMCLVLVATFCCCEQLPPDDDTSHKTTDNVFLSELGNPSFYEDFSTEETNLFYSLWKNDTTISFQIDIEPSELYAMSYAFDHKWENPELLEMYRKCNLTIVVNGVSYYFEEVGIRMHGNTSKRAFCNEDGIMYALVNFRFKFTETFDGDEYEGTSIYHDWQKDTPEGKAARKARKARTFATMEKCYIKWNKSYDTSYTREVFASRLLWQYGIMNPHVTWTNIAIKQNGSMENVGMGTLYETIDEEFVNRYFDDANQGGDLYKCLYQGAPADMTKFENYGIETASWTPTYDLKTNNDPDEEGYSDHHRLREFISEINTLDPYEEGFETDLEKIVPMNYFAQMEAVNYLLGNPDCIRNNYNNYYTYFAPSGLAIFGVYDYDWSLGNTWDNHNIKMETIAPNSLEGGLGKCKNPLYRKTFLEGGNSYYNNLLNEFVAKVLQDDYFTSTYFNALLEAFEENYGHLIAPSDAMKASLRDVDTYKLSQLDGRSVNQYIFDKRATANKALEALGAKN